MENAAGLVVGLTQGKTLGLQAQHIYVGYKSSEGILLSMLSENISNVLHLFILLILRSFLVYKISSLVKFLNHGQILVERPSFV